MKGRVPPLVSMVVGLLMVSGPLFAHHSDSVYDQDHLVTITGTVTQFQFINPHQLIHLEVKDAKGNVEQWIALGGPPNQMSRVGWNAHTIKQGQPLTITGFQFYDGRKVMLHLKVVQANGQVLPASEAEGNFLKRFENRQEKKP